MIEQTQSSNRLAALATLLALLGSASVSGSPFDLQGLSKGETAWVTGNVQNWNELDYIPCRVAISGKAFTGQQVTILFPHLTGTTPGFQNLYRFTTSSNVAITSPPVLSAPAGADWSYSFTIDHAGGDGHVAFEARLAAGAHLNTGSSLMLRGMPSSMGNLQVHKPAPGPGLPDLAIVKTGPATAAAGDLISYTLAYTNQAGGTNIARGAQISDILPPQLTAVQAVGGEIQGTTIFWDLPDLPAGVSGTLAFTARISTNVSFGQTITNYAQILSSEDDLNFGDNSSKCVTTLSINRPPIAQNDAYSVAEDATLIIPAPGVLANDSDPDGNGLSAQLVSQPTHGILSGFDGNTGAVTYSPNTNYVGVDSFTYKVNDGLLDSMVAAVTIDVTPVNDAPVADDQSVTTPEDTSKAIQLTGSDVDGDSLTYVLVSQPTHGMLSGFDGNTGAVIYTPDTDYFGGDSFTFKVNDGLLDSIVATVTIDVTPVNDAPVADDQSVTTPEDTSKAIQLTGSDVDGDSLTYMLVSQPTHGMLSGFDGNTGAVIYTPDTDYFGGDSFTFKVNDGLLESGVATVTIDVTPVNDFPITPREGGLFTVLEDGILEVPAPGLLADMVDPDGDLLSILLVSNANNGTLQVTTNGAFTHRPDADFFGPDFFLFQVSDGTALSSVLAASIQVVPVNDPPSFIKGGSRFHQLNAPQQVIPGWASAITSGPANESDQALAFLVTTDNPSLFAQVPQIAPDGTLQYTPASGQAGVAVVTVVLHDNGGTANGGVDACEPQMFSITVNSPPTVTMVTPEDGAEELVPVGLTVAAAAEDSDGTITRLSLFQSTNLLATVTNLGSHYVILTNVAPGTYEFSAFAEDDRGASAWSEPVTVTVHDSPPVETLAPPKLNLNTGLFEQRIRIANPSYYTLEGVLVLVSDLPPGTVVINATGTTNGVAYVRSVSSIPPGGELLMTLEYYVPTSHFPNPTLAVRTDAIPQNRIQYAGIPQRIHQGRMRSDGGFMLEFETAAGRLYAVEYSPNLRDWKGAQPPITGDGVLYQWIDQGQPKTECPPADAPVRLYRVILLP